LIGSEYPSIRRWIGAASFFHGTSDHGFNCLWADGMYVETESRGEEIFDIGDCHVLLLHEQAVPQLVRQKVLDLHVLNHPPAATTKAA
jgi:hypothetical protein